jgi:hypothetical protein
VPASLALVPSPPHFVLRACVPARGRLQDECRASIRRVGGMEIPLNMFLFQEAQRLDAVVRKVHATLASVQAAIRGEVVLTSDLASVMNDLYDAKVRTRVWAMGGVLGRHEWSVHPTRARSQRHPMAPPPHPPPAT